MPSTSPSLPEDDPEEEWSNDEPWLDRTTGLRRMSHTQDLCNISYSRETTIRAFKDYYEFLIGMYMDEEEVLWPPGDGWPGITLEGMRGLGKTDQVVELLRRLPYVRRGSGERRLHTLGRTQFTDWTDHAQFIPEEYTSLFEAKFAEPIPPHVIGLSNYGNDILLDTRLGVVYFHECPYPIRFDLDLPHRPICDEAYEYSPPEEAEWRGWGAAWGIVEFFEVMKWLFRELQYVPVKRHFVEEIWEDDDGDTCGARAVAAEIFRKHGWPNEMERYRKAGCLEEVERVIEERWPEMFLEAM